MTDKHRYVPTGLWSVILCHFVCLFMCSLLCMSVCLYVSLSVCLYFALCTKHSMCLYACDVWLCVSVVLHEVQRRGRGKVVKQLRNQGMQNSQFSTFYVYLMYFVLTADNDWKCYYWFNVIQSSVNNSALACLQKFLNFFRIFKAWNVLENRHGYWKFLNLCLKVLENTWIWFFLNAVTEQLIFRIRHSEIYP